MRPIVITLFCLLSLNTQAADNVLVVTLDGLRWQELFYGVDETLLETEDNPQVRDAVMARYGQGTIEERRAALMPFFWSEIAQKGTLIGDHRNDSKMSLSNAWWFSYPGYNEILTGVADDKIDSNASEFNQNKTFLEYLHKQNHHVAAFGSWDVFPYIINTERNDFVVNAGFTGVNWDDASEHAHWLAELQSQIPSPWYTVRLDAFTHGFTQEYIKQHQPNIIYVALGETDDFAHDGEYVQYLQAAHRSDSFIKSLWELLQSIPQYKDNTNILLTTDHGRGTTQLDWTHHASKASLDGYMSKLKPEFPEGIVDADQVWFAAMGPNIAQHGIVRSTETYSLNQFAATVLATLAIDHRDFNPKAGKPLPVLTPTAQITPVNETKSLTRIGFGSCLKENKPQPLWDDVMAQNPDLFVLMGDNVYGDTEDMQELANKYQLLAQQPGFAELRSTTPVIGIWDDHDYGENDAGAEYPKKVESKQIMLDFFGEPKHSERRMRNDGAYTSYMFNDGERKVHIILPDLRYNRTPLASVNKLSYTVNRLPNDQGPYQIMDDPQATMLGEQQWQWLESELAKPADLKILISSLQVVADFTGWEAWTNFKADQSRLYGLIQSLALDNLLIISGDTHWSEISRRTVGDIDLVDMTASGMTEEWKQISPNQYRASEAHAIANFGMLTIDWDTDPINATLQIIAEDGKVLIEQNWRR